MAKETSFKTRNFALTTVKETSTSGGGSFYEARYSGLKKRINLSQKVIDEVTKKCFNWQSTASWRAELLAAGYNRRTEQSFIDTQKALCSLPALREDIIQVRKELSRAGQSCSIGLVAAAVCEAWKVPNANRWVEWLS